MKKLMLMIMTLVSVQSAQASYEVLVEGTKGFFCRRGGALYNHITEDELRLVAVKMSQTDEFLNAPGVPSVIRIGSVDPKRNNISGAGLVHLNFKTKAGEYGYNERSPSPTYTMGMLICNF